MFLNKKKEECRRAGAVVVAAVVMVAAIKKIVDYFVCRHLGANTQSVCNLFGWHAHSTSHAVV